MPVDCLGIRDMEKQPGNWNVLGVREIGTCCTMYPMDPAMVRKLSYSTIWAGRNVVWELGE